MQKLKMIGFNTTLDLAGDEFEECYLELINYGNWQNNTIIEEMWQKYDSGDYYSSDQVKSWTRLINSLIEKEKDKVIQKDNEEFEKFDYDLEFFGDQAVRLY